MRRRRDGLVGISGAESRPAACAQATGRCTTGAAAESGRAIPDPSRQAQPEHRDGGLGQSQRHLSLSRLRPVGGARRRRRPAGAAGDRQGRLPEHDGRAAPQGSGPWDHAVQHHELPQEDGGVRDQHRPARGLHHQALQRGDARSRRTRHREGAGSERQEGEFQRRGQRHPVLHAPDLRVARHQGRARSTSDRPTGTRW